MSCSLQFRIRRRVGMLSPQTQHLQRSSPCHLHRFAVTGSQHLLAPNRLLLWDVDATTVFCRTYSDVQLILLKIFGENKRLIRRLPNACSNSATSDWRRPPSGLCRPVRDVYGTSGTNDIESTHTQAERAFIECQR